MREWSCQLLAVLYLVFGLDESLRRVLLRLDSLKLSKCFSYMASFSSKTNPYPLSYNLSFHFLLYYDLPFSFHLDLSSSSPMPQKMVGLNGQNGQNEQRNKVNAMIGKQNSSGMLKREEIVPPPVFAKMESSPAI